MNERIKELAFRAGFIGESMNPIFGTCQETALKNFAELIVRECLDCATWVGEFNKNPVEPVHTARAINKRIKQRFGVEE